MKVGDIVCPNGLYNSSAAVLISNIRSAKVMKVFRNGSNGSDGMEIKILEGNGSANPHTTSITLEMGWGPGRRFRNPQTFSAGGTVRVFQRPFRIMSKANPGAMGLPDCDLPAMDDIMLIMALT